MAVKVDQARVRQLAEMIEANIQPPQERARPALRVVRDEPPERRFMLPHERDMRYSLIRDIARVHGIQWFLRRELEHVGGIIEHLDDAGLVGLHATMRRAQDCILEGIGFDDAGLM
jgi:hypothetical protein